MVSSKLPAAFWLILLLGLLLAPAARSFTPPAPFLTRASPRAFQRRACAVCMSSEEDHADAARLSRRRALADLLTFTCSSALPAGAAEPLCPAGSGRALGLPAIGAKTKRLILCRHGETELNRLGKIQGRRMNPPLNPRGRRQAQELAAALCGVRTSAVFSSELERAIETADEVEKFHAGARRSVLADLDEVDFGSSEGKSLESSRLRISATYARWIMGDEEARATPEGESYREVATRARRALDELLGSCREGEAVVAVSHSSYLRFLLQTCLGWRYGQARMVAQGNCCVDVIDYDGKDFHLLLLNEISFLNE